MIIMGEVSGYSNTHDYNGWGFQLTVVRRYCLNEMYTKRVTGLRIRQGRIRQIDFYTL